LTVDTVMAVGARRKYTRCISLQSYNPFCYELMSNKILLNS